MFTLFYGLFLAGKLDSVSAALGRKSFGAFPLAQSPGEMIPATASFHRLPLVNETFHLPVLLFVELLPVFIDVQFRDFVMVGEHNAVFQLIKWWHVVFDNERRNVFCAHPDDTVGTLLRWLSSLRQTGGPAPLNRPRRTVVRLQAEDGGAS